MKELVEWSIEGCVAVGGWCPNQWTSPLSDSDFILVGSVLNCYVLIAGWKNSRRLARYEVLNTLSFSKLQTSMLFMILLVDSLLIASSQVCASPLELI